MRKYIFLLFALTAFFTLSCDKEPSFADLSQTGRDVELSLEISSGVMPQVIVKSGWEDNSSAESAVYNLRIYIFSADDGSLVGYKLFNSSELSFAAGTSPYEKTASLSGIKAKTGQVYIYAIANSTTSQYRADGTGIAKILDVVDVSKAGFTRGDFLKAYTTRQGGGFNPLDNVFMMTGYVNGGNPVTVSLKEGRGNYGEITSPTSADDKMLKLYKVVSKNTFIVNVDNSEGKNITFTPDYYAVYSVPQGYALLPKLPDGDEASRPAAAEFENFTRIISTDSENTFYLPENLQSGNIKNKEAVRDFKTRESNTYGENNSSPKTFVNAPGNATYVTVHGRFFSSDYAGMVSYTVHLGDFSRNAADFDVTRNYAYKYTITIKGASDFVAECERTGDDPGSEGTLINFREGMLYQLDAHYESRVLKLEKEETDAIINRAEGLMFRVATAFCDGKQLLVKDDGVYDFTSPGKPKLCGFDENGQPTDLTKLYNSGEADFNWVRFVKNTEANKVVPDRAISDVCKYPGTANTKNVFQILSDIYKSEKEGGTDDFFDDVDENGKKVAYVSVFVDENYYPGKTWPEYVNKDTPRVMYLSSTSYEVSADGHSAYSNPKFILAQRSIWTFYVKDSSILPFGIETVNEEQAVSEFSFSIGSSVNVDAASSEGYSAARNVLKGPYLNSGYYFGNTYNRGTQDLYENIYKACYSRNRDENGNGTIDEDELKWYLPTIRELVGVWIGEDIMLSEAKLFSGTESAWTDYDKIGEANGRKKYHFFSATNTNNGKNPLILWAEEGSSTSWKDRGSWSDATLVRCVRTLESGTSDSPKYGRKDHDHFVDYKAETDGTTVIDVKIDKAALRPYSSTPMSPSFERGETSTNRIYSSFQMAAENLRDKSHTAVGDHLAGGTYSRGEVTNSGNGREFISSQDDVCFKAMGGSWRVPNQKELILMSFSDDIINTYANNRDSDNTWKNARLWSSTVFTATSRTGNYNYSKTGSGVYNLEFSNGNISMSLDNNTRYNKNYVRCVRDIRQ